MENYKVRKVRNKDKFKIYKGKERLDGVQFNSRGEANEHVVQMVKNQTVHDLNNTKKKKNSLEVPTPTKKVTFKKKKKEKDIVLSLPKL